MRCFTSTVRVILFIGPAGAHYWLETSLTRSTSRWKNRIQTSWNNINIFLIQYGNESTPDHLDRFFVPITIFETKLKKILKTSKGSPCQNGPSRAPSSSHILPTNKNNNKTMQNKRFRWVSLFFFLKATGKPRRPQPTPPVLPVDRPSPLEDPCVVAPHLLCHVGLEPQLVETAGFSNHGFFAVLCRRLVVWLLHGFQAVLGGFKE